MRENYKIFVYDSRNTGSYIQDFYQTLTTVRNYAKEWCGNKYRIEGEDNFFELYENGEKTEWSA